MLWSDASPPPPLSDRPVLSFQKHFHASERSDGFGWNLLDIFDLKVIEGIVWSIQKHFALGKCCVNGWLVVQHRASF